MQRRAIHGSRALSALLVLLMAPAGAGARSGGSAPPSTQDAESSGAPGAALPLLAPAPQPEASAGVTGTGVYRGTVTDRRSGKPVNGGTIIFLNEETNQSFEAKTDEKGYYEVHLPAGEYVVDIKVGRKAYRSTGTFKEEAKGQKWVMDFTIGTKLTEKDLKITTTPRDIRVIQAEPRPPLEASKKWMEFFIFVGGLAVVGALAN